MSKELQTETSHYFKISTWQCVMCPAKLDATKMTCIPQTGVFVCPNCLVSLKKFAFTFKS